MVMLDHLRRAITSSSRLASFVTLTFALVVSEMRGQRAMSDPPLAITSVTVVDVSAASAGSALRTNQTVVIRDGRIVAEGATRTTAIPAGAQRISGAGKFLGIE